MKYFLLSWFACSTAFAGSVPVDRLAMFFAQPQSISQQHGSCGTFTHDLFIRAFSSDGTNTMTASGFDITADKLLTISVAASNNAPITVSDTANNVWIAASSVINSDIVSKQFYCISPIVTNNDQFFAKADGCSPVLQVNTFECTGTPIFDGQSAGGGGSGSTTYQPGSIAPFSGTELFTLGAGVDIAGSTFTVGSSFNANTYDTSGNISVGSAYKMSSTSENPVVTVDNTTENVSVSMLMFGSVDCSSSSSPLVTAQTLGTARTDAQAGVGITFIASSAATFDHLGRWVYSGNTGTHIVSLQNAAGTILTSCSVNTTLGTPGQYLEVSCTPFTLVIGTRYFILSAESGGDTYGNEAAVTCDTTVVGVGVNHWNSAFVSGGIPVVNSSDDSFGPVNGLWH